MAPLKTKVSGVEMRMKVGLEKDSRFVHKNLVFVCSSKVVLQSFCDSSFGFMLNLGVPNRD